MKQSKWLKKAMKEAKQAYSKWPAWAKKADNFNVSQTSSQTKERKNK